MATSTHEPEHGFPQSLIQAALSSARALPQAAPVWGLSALQGTGKSTFAAQLAAAAQRDGLTAAVLSLDDFYLTRDARRTLARQVHPLLQTRGPPGTHDLPLALFTLNALRHGVPTKLPRFNKLTDDRMPESQWTTLDAPAQLVILEGWCLGTPAQKQPALARPINALERDEDAHGTWRHFCNDALARAYPALWSQVDQLWFLQPPGFDVVLEWRWQQEQLLQANGPSPGAMDRAGIARFVQHYERISLQALRTLPAIADRTIELDRDRVARNTPPG